MVPSAAPSVLELAPMSLNVEANTVKRVPAK
jgi:hypothetical protein